MKDQIEQRLLELRVEFSAGQKLLADLDTRQMNLRNSLLRISGAIQVLEELLIAEPEGNQESVNAENPEMQPVEA